MTGARKRTWTKALKLIESISSKFETSGSLNYKESNKLFPSYDLHKYQYENVNEIILNNEGARRENSYFHVSLYI